MTSSPDAPRFFLDRGLGAHIVPAGLRAAGWFVTTMDESYGADASQHIADVDWIAEASQRGESLLSKDSAVARRPAEAVAVVMNDARFFALANARVTGPEILQCFLTNEVAIFRWATRVTPPFVVAVGPDWVRRRRLAVH